MAVVRILVAALALCALAGQASAASHATVALKDIEIKPARVTISRGGSVTWRFLDGVAPHNVASGGSLRFRSSSTKQSGTYTVRFTRRGTYRYHCTIHPNMQGRVIVR